jgi:hypothetical protein
VETCKTRTIVRAVLKKQEASPDLFSNRTGSSHQIILLPGTNAPVYSNVRI